MLPKCDDKSVLHKIIDKHSNMIYKICFVHLKNKYDAEDAYQELIIKIIERAPHFLSDEHEKAWLIKVACNHCKNITRFNKLRNHLKLDEYMTSSDASNVDDTLEHILNLPLQYRNVLYLYYYEDYTTKEIASLLNRRDATIRTWLKRAREKLKDIIGGEDNE